jgi:hypothetical protein
MTFAVLALTALLAGSPGPAAESPTFLFEWISKTGAASRRLTLFTDRVLVRKSVSEDGKTEMKKRKLSEDEYAFYAKYFANDEFEASARDFDTGLAGDGAEKSTVVVAPPEAPKYTISFDAFSVLSAPAAQLKAALEGLRDSYGKVLPNEEDFTREKVVRGAILRRRDGQEFRVVSVSEDSGVVEMQAVGQPYSQFFEWSKLRYMFFPP